MVTICAGVTILAHDYSWSVLREAYGVSLPTGGGKVSIGNNCFVGENSTILRGVEIGDNCIIGAGAIVTKNVEANSVVCGIPAKKIMSLGDFKNKREKQLKDEILLNIKEFECLNGRMPTENEMSNFNFLFLQRDEKNKEIIRNSDVVGGNKETNYNIFISTHPLWSSYQAMIEDLLSNNNKI